MEPVHYTMKKIPDEDLLSDLQRVADLLEKSPTQADYREQGQHGIMTVINRFDGWNEAKRKAGLETYSGRGHTERRTDTKWGWYWAQKEDGTCALCDEDYAKCLTYHHRSGAEKIEGVGRMARYAEYDLDDLQQEVEKCVLICQNCHKKVHASDHPASI